MKRIAGLILLSVLIALPFNVDGQLWKLRRYEGSLGISATNNYFDIGKSSPNPLLGFKTIMLGTTRPSFSFGARYKINGDMALKLNMTYGYLFARDAGGLDWREYTLGLTIFEPSVQFEYYLLTEGRTFSTAALFNRRGMLNNYNKLYAYVFGGLGGSIFSPRDYEGLDEHAYFTEFQKFALVLPVGIGIKYSIDSQWSLGIEYGRRFTFTDKIDALDTNFSKRSDIYDFTTISAIYKVRTDRRGRPIFRKPYSR